MQELYDMHSHLDFAQDSEQIAKLSSDMAINSIVSTVVPSSFVSALEKYEGLDNLKVSLGLHPWWVASGRVTKADLDRFQDLIEQTHLVGEIGLDFADKFKDTKDKQLSALNFVLDAVEQAGSNRLLTFHAIKSSSILMDIIKNRRTLKDNQAILHWFSGSHEEFGRALSMGFFFSVSMKMLANPKTREYAQAIPDEQLLLETDAPAHEGDIYSAEIWREELENTIYDLAELRGVEKQKLTETLNENSKKLLLAE